MGRGAGGCDGGGVGGWGLVDEMDVHCMCDEVNEVDHVDGYWDGLVGRRLCVRVRVRVRGW